MIQAIRDFLHQIGGPCCVDCLSVKLSLPDLEVGTALGELGTQVLTVDGRFSVGERTCIVCGRFTTTATFRPKGVEGITLPPCRRCQNPIMPGDGVAVVNEGRVVKVHMRCLRAFRASRLDV